MDQRASTLEHQLRDDLAHIRQEMSIMARAEPQAAPAGPGWDREPDLAAVVLRCKEDLPKDSFLSAATPLLADAGVGDDSCVVEAEPLGKRFVLRFQRVPGLGVRRARQVLGPVRIGRGELREMGAPAGPAVQINVGADQNRKHIARELLLERLAMALGRVVGPSRKMLVDKIAHSLTMSWRAFLWVSIASPTAAA